MIQAMESYVDHLPQVREEQLDLLLPELIRYGLIAVEVAPEVVEEPTMRTFGEYLLPNLWINRNTGTRAYYELMWHDGRNYRLVTHHFADYGKMIEDEDFYNVYVGAVCCALLEPELPYNLTMCQLQK